MSTVLVRTGLRVAACIVVAAVSSSCGDSGGGGPGPAPARIIRINEFNANIASGCDLIELRVIDSGSTAGLRVRERSGTVASNELDLALPAITVAKNDIIVVHLNGTSATCNSGGATMETTDIAGQPASTYPGNFDTAFDIWADDAGLNATDNVFTVVDSTGVIVDAVFASDDPAGLTTAASTLAAAGIVGAAGEWVPAHSSYTDSLFRVDAVDDLNATGTIANGNSIQRVNDGDLNSKADWTTGAGAAETFGLINVGESPL